MNIKNKNSKISNNKKGLLAVVLFIFLAFVFYGIIVKNVENQEKLVRDEYQMELIEKESAIEYLEKKLKDTELLAEVKTQDEKNKLSDTALDKQIKYTQAASEFLTHYLNYDTEKLSKRRENLLEITDKELINKIAPEPTKEENAFSSDPTFVSEITEFKTFISNESGETVEIISEVDYETTSIQGDSKVKAYIKLKLNMDKNGIIKITEYFYYPIKK